MKKELFDGYNRLKSKFANMIVEEVKKEPESKKDLNFIFYQYNVDRGVLEDEYLTEIAIVNDECLIRTHVFDADGYEEQVVPLHDLPMDELFAIAECL